MKTELKIINFKATQDDKNRWSSAAHKQRMTLSKWIRLQLDAGVGEDSAATAVSQPSPTPAQVKEKAEVVAEQLLHRARQATVVCFNRVPDGAFCKRCGRIHGG